MAFKILEHTADIRMLVNGKSQEELFREALKGMMSVIKSEIKNLKTRIEKREIAVKADDRTALLVDFLSEVLALSQINGEIYTEVNFSEFSEKELRAELNGFKAKNFDEDIKAVTYHEAEIKQNEKGEWETTLIFDI